MGKGKICAFFGHRTVETDLSDALYDAIRKAITEYGVRTFWCGNKGEFDRMAAKTAFQLKREFPDIEIIYVRAYLPKSGEKLPECYDDSIYPEGLESVPKRFTISRRNMWMARNCDMAIVYIEHDWGGAYQAYCAIGKEKTTIRIGKKTAFCKNCRLGLPKNGKKSDFMV